MNDFGEWLQNNTNLKDASINKYTNAIRTISKDMLANGVISKPLVRMEDVELDISIALIFYNQSFVAKDERGNRMYSNALKQYRYFVSSFCETDNSVELDLVKQVELSIDINETERKAIIYSRIGQGTFRQELLKKYHSCVITKVDIPRLLIASHIKPWVVSDNFDRVSIENGLILAPTYDKLFDNGLITFDKNGQIFISSFINTQNIENLHLDKNGRYDLKPTAALLKNLQYHNDVVFVK